MEDFFSEQSGKSPLLRGNVENGTIEVAGVCLLEDAKVFFKPFVDWIEDMAVQTPADQISLSFDMHYFNTTTAKILLDIIKLVSSLATTQNKSFEALWIYERDDDDMKETGLDYQAMVGNVLRMRAKDPISE